MNKVKFVYPIHDVIEYINWIYFFHAWGFTPRFATVTNVHGCDSCRAVWLNTFPKSERTKATEALHLYKEAEQMLQLLDRSYSTFALCRLCEANADGDNLILDGLRLPLLRQQTSINPEGPYLCLSDFVRPFDPEIKDCVGVFSTTVDPHMLTQYPNDPYKQLLIQTLADRLAEATAEKLHQYVRRQMWGYAPNERLTIAQLHREEFQGIRPAVGYPSLPDLSVNFLLDELMDMKTIGITLTEHGAMKPHASVSGLMISHPAATYFAIGRISNEQFTDYALRRGFSKDVMKKFLTSIL